MPAIIAGSGMLSCPPGSLLPGRSLPDAIGPLDDWNGGLSSRGHPVRLPRTPRRFDRRSCAPGWRPGPTRRRRGAECPALRSVRLLRAAGRPGPAGRRRAQPPATESHLRWSAPGGKPGARCPRPTSCAAFRQAEVASQPTSCRRSPARSAPCAPPRDSSTPPMGRPAGTPLAIVAPAADAPPPAADDIEAASRRAVAARPELQSEQRRLEAARANVEAGARRPRA